MGSYTHWLCLNALTRVNAEKTAEQRSAVYHVFFDEAYDYDVHAAAASAHVSVPVNIRVPVRLESESRNAELVTWFLDLPVDKQALFAFYMISEAFLFTDSRFAEYLRINGGGPLFPSGVPTRETAEKNGLDSLLHPARGMESMVDAIIQRPDKVDDSQKRKVRGAVMRLLFNGSAEGLVGAFKSVGVQLAVAVSQNREWDFEALADWFYSDALTHNQRVNAACHSVLNDYGWNSAELAEYTRTEGPAIDGATYEGLFFPDGLAKE